MCSFNFCHITVVRHTFCQVQCCVNRHFLLAQIEATEIVLASSAAAIKILLSRLLFLGGGHLSFETVASSGLNMQHGWKDSRQRKP